MSWTDESALHEGYLAYVTRDGRLAGSSNAQGAFVYRTDASERLKMAEVEGRPAVEGDTWELVPWADVIGWQNCCHCYSAGGSAHRPATTWTGQRWMRADTTPGEFGGHDPEDATLPDGVTVEDAARADWEANHIAGVSVLRELEEAHWAEVAARAHLDAVVAKARATTPPTTWETIAQALKMRKQSAHQRWGNVG